MKRYLLSILVTLLSLSATAQWKAYLSYYEPTEIEQATDDILFVLASGGLYSYNTKDHQIVTYDKVSVLSDCNISHIAWCQAAKRLVIVYDDYNIDLLSINGDIVNMPAYMNASMTAEKTVNNIDIAGKYAYISTAFGVMQINVADAEFTNTFNLGFRVDYCYTEGNHIYAASSTNGLYRGLTTDNLNDPAQWTRTDNYTARPKTMDPDLLAIVNTLSPGGPKTNSIGLIKFHNNRLYTASTGSSITESPGYVQIYDGNNWSFSEDYTSINDKTGVKFSSLFDFDISPTDDNHIVVASQSGLYEFDNLQFTKLWNNDNSPLVTASTVGNNNRNYVVVTGAKYADDGNIWVFNAISPSTSLFQLSASGEWTSHHKSDLFVSNRTPTSSLELVRSIIQDSNDNIWAVNDFYRDPSVFRYQPSTDKINVFKSLVNEDGTTMGQGYVRCIVEDKEGNLWIGTDKGPMMIEASELTADSPVFYQVKIARNDGSGLADYLLSGVDIQCIAIDRQNRKWFGTGGNGVYLMSSSNTQEVEHFTKDNSPLLSDVVTSISLDHATGEVFFATNNGLCSYTSKTSDGSDGMTKDNVYAYPNPVRPDYKGVITVTGLEDGAYVKIATANGTLVTEGESSSGQYKWYGLDKEGKRVASGIYMVEVSTAEGGKGVVCKIAIVN